MKRMTTLDLKKLFEEKKYSKIINIIETQTNDQNRNSGQLNLLGVCKLLKQNTKESLLSAKKDFRRAYLQEKNTHNGRLALKNFINLSVDLFDQDFYLGETPGVPNEKIFEEEITYFNEQKDFFEKNDKFIRPIIRIFKRNLDLDNLNFYLKKIIDMNHKDIGSICTYIYWNNYRKDWDQKKFFEFSKILNQRLPLYPKNELVNLNSSKNKKINLAFFSADIRSRHPVTFFLKTVLMDYDKDKFDIFLYYNNIKEDETTEEFRQYIPKIKNIYNLSDVEAINIIRNDKIDIMINLMGVTSENRLQLFKNRLAKKQVLWCGYNNTTGIDEMDYLISDKNSIFENEKNLYTENIIYLKDIWSCHSGFPIKREFVDAPMNQNKFVTFGSFNNFRKINDNVVKVWSSILRKLPNSKLILKSSDTASTSLIAEKFNKNGVLSSIEFHPYIKNIGHLDDYKKIDIALDTFPYNGVTTSFESIWMGVPVLTMMGHNFMSRGGESINKNLKLEELICKDEDDYIKKAVSFANDRNKILGLRKIIYEKALLSPLFDKKKFCKEFFSSLEKIYS